MTGSPSPSAPRLETICFYLEVLDGGGVHPPLHLSLPLLGLLTLFFYRHLHFLFLEGPLFLSPRPHSATNPGVGKEETQKPATTKKSKGGCACLAMFEEATAVMLTTRNSRGVRRHGQRRGRRHSQRNQVRCQFHGSAVSRNLQSVREDNRRTKVFMRSTLVVEGFMGRTLTLGTRSTTRLPQHLSLAAQANWEGSDSASLRMYADQFNTCVQRSLARNAVSWPSFARVVSSTRPPSGIRRRSWRCRARRQGACPYEPSAGVKRKEAELKGHRCVGSHPWLQG